jgi:hypothetical protein
MRNSGEVAAPGESVVREFLENAQAAGRGRKENSRVQRADSKEIRAKRPLQRNLKNTLLQGFAVVNDQNYPCPKLSTI